ncbi:hypothetical protein AB833_15080 [Chromatiales bacterium (ex Bugula neritina AB1)]|nr:hypothetical protein AB833_15080 [Chromatiales bacterium (ex Bugula neritina AB1)]
MEESGYNVKKYTFENGPAIDESLVEWLDAEVNNRLIQLPVEVHSGPLGVEATFLRSGDTDIEIDLDTTGLTLDLSMYLNPICDSYPCKVWMEGVWGALISDYSEQLVPIFAVSKVVGIAEAQDISIRLLKM